MFLCPFSDSHASNYLLFDSNFRPCNSRNFNQSPLCTADKKEGPVKWAETVREMYRGEVGSGIPAYIKTLTTSVRDSYGTETLKKNVLIEPKAEVNIRDARKIIKTNNYLR